MTIITRRNFIKTAAAASTLPLMGRAAFADEPLKVGYIYLGPVGDFGWTWAHEKARKAMVAISAARSPPTMSRTSPRIRARPRSSRISPRKATS